jgi:hypothetical protein
MACLSHATSSDRWMLWRRVSSCSSSDASMIRFIVLQLRATTSQAQDAAFRSLSTGLRHAAWLFSEPGLLSGRSRVA